MAVTAYLVDKSVLARLDKPPVLAALQPLVGQLATCSSVRLEIGWSARSVDHHRQMMADLALYQALEIDQSILDLAETLQGALVARGNHRGPGVADLILAATAIEHEAFLLHYDQDFDLIAAVDGRLAHRWVVPRGTID